jgi:hypothetical protein
MTIAPWMPSRRVRVPMKQRMMSAVWAIGQEEAAQ